MTNSTRTLRRLAIICTIPAMLASPAAADPTVGIGLSIAFGGGKTDTGIALRVFSDDQREKVVGAIGVDYMFTSQRWRGTIGPAYLGRNAFIGLDLGIGLGDGAIDFGVSAGGADTKAPVVPAAPTTPPPVSASE